MEGKMKKHLSKIVFITAFSFGFIFQSCILDAFDSIYINLAIPVSFNVSGSTATPSPVVRSVCLDTVSIYNKYKDRIESIEYVISSYRTTDVGTGAAGNLTLTLQESSGTPLFSKTLTNVNIANYTTTPYTLSLTSAEVTLINNYFKLSSNRCFIATLQASNISPVPFNFKGSLDIAFRMKVKL